MKTCLLIFSHIIHNTYNFLPHNTIFYFWYSLRLNFVILIYSYWLHITYSMWCVCKLDYQHCIQFCKELELLELWGVALYFVLYFFIYHSHRLWAAFLGGFLSWQQTGDDDGFSSTSKSSATKFFPKLKVGETAEKHTLMDGISDIYCFN